jgi:hypothetical protein
MIHDWLPFFAYVDNEVAFLSHTINESSTVIDGRNS